jgi:Putative DNA-binding domain
MSSLTGRYTSSPESRMEFDLARFRNVEDSAAFLGVRGRICEETLTSDFWSITLPTELATSSPQSPSLFAYYAALVLLDAKVLFSEQKVADLLSPGTVGHRSALERHHLFPKAYLKTLDIDDLRETNQIGNYAIVEWGDNAGIADQPPEGYWPLLAHRHGPRELERMCYWHALPDGWESLEYKEFLTRRRELMAKVIADGYRRLCDAGALRGKEEDTISIVDVIGDGETEHVELKSTLRINMHTKMPDPRMELACLKTITGFLNVRGGKLIIGVGDDRAPIGIETDGFSSEDKMHLHLVNLIKDKIGAQHMMYVHPRFEEFEETRIMLVECWRSRSPVYLKEGNIERFFIRTGASTTELTGSALQEYIKQRF